MFSPEMVSLSGEKQVMLTTQIVQLMKKKLKEEVSLWQVMQQVQLQLYEIKDEKMVDDG